MHVIMRKHRLVRWIPEGWAADLVVKPTPEQVRVLRRLADSAREYGRDSMRLIQRRVNARSGEMRGRGREDLVTEGYEVAELVEDYW
jgi:hypothetical protein